MGASEKHEALTAPGGLGVETTRPLASSRWGAVVAVGGGTNPEAESALEALCQAYWYPLYAYVRRTGRNADEAQDLTQEFFAGFLQRSGFSVADHARGRLRTFLLTSMKHFLANEWKREHRLKRGGNLKILSLDAAGTESRLAGEPADSVTPELIYERQWVSSLLQQVMRTLGEECAATGHSTQFEQLKASLWGENQLSSQVEIAAHLGMTESAYRVAAHRMRARYRELLRREIAHTLGNVAEVDDELRHLVAVMSG